MGFKREIPVGCLDEVLFPDSHTLPCHGFLLSQPADMLNDGIRKYYIKRLILNKPHVPSIAHQCLDKRQGWLDGVSVDQGYLNFRQGTKIQRLPKFLLTAHIQNGDGG